VKLVGIVLADTGLHLPDFRAAERTFGLIVQVAGRAGRFHPDGRVLVQTYQPQVPAIRLAVAHDLPGFYAAELGVREELGFPPFARLIRMVVRGRDGGQVRRTAEKIARACSGALGPEDEVLGPAECPLATVSGNIRHHVIVRTRSFGAAHERIAAALPGVEVPAGVHIEVDVDPVALL
jgi:primosomal protein N' (replication factor Y)